MTTTPRQYILVPHTHWDREWYQTFQQFRRRLVKAVDKVLDVLERDPAFSHFMLDGQTIVLEDYLEVRPEQAERLRAHIQSGRILIGPWYLQPDEFLVGGEALIRNLLHGAQVGAAYGEVMKVGYVPDCFGHLAQLPQILQGFGIDNAIFWRGIGAEVRQSEFWWAAPDGTRVLVLWLAAPNGYSNASTLPLNTRDFLARLQGMESAILPKSTTGILLLMNGSDHQEPQDGLPAVLAEANRSLEDCQVRIGTLPQYVAAIKNANPSLQTLSGEWRSGQLAPLLPAVLSTRIWIKQRNTAGEQLLERYAEPFAAWAWALGESYPAGFLRVAWKHLLHNQPHDSICGCSIDQVHREMVSRYDQSEQVAEGVITEALAQISARIKTIACAPGSRPVFVYNPAGPQSAVVTCAVESRGAIHDLVISDAAGHLLPSEIISRASKEMGAFDLTAEEARSMLGMVAEGQASGYSIVRIDIHPGREAGVVEIVGTITSQGEPDLAAVKAGIAQATALSEQPGFKRFHIVLLETQQQTVRFLARDLPAYGYKTFLARPRRPEDAAAAQSDLHATEQSIENAYYRVSADATSGTLTVLDKTTGATYSGLNRFEDGGDVGDLYTYCPPLEADSLVSAPARPPQITLLAAGPVCATLRITQEYALPAHCTEDRKHRSETIVPCMIASDVSLSPGIQRIDIHTTIANSAKDHHLRVLFPAPFAVDEAEAEGTFEVRRRPARVTPPAGAADWSDWVEPPVNTHPQKRFVAVSNGTLGLAVINRGLPEYEARPTADGQETTVALTLLRCVEWLSRGDLATRRGHAGPMEYTPEAQMLGTWQFDYALVPHAGDWRASDGLVEREALAFNAPPRAVPGARHVGSLPLEQSLVTLAPGTLLLSAIKRAEREDALVVRCYNPLTTEEAATLTLGLAFREARLARLDEEPLGAEQQARLERLSEQQLRLRIRAGEIVTLLVRF